MADENVEVVNENFRIVKTEEVNPGDCPSDPDFPAKYRYIVEFTEDEPGVQRTAYSDGNGEFKRGRDDWLSGGWEKLTEFLRVQEENATE